MLPRLGSPNPSSRPIRIVLAVVLCLIACAANARTPLEREWSRYDGRPLAWLRLQGAPAGLGGDLREGLALSGKSRLLRKRVLPEFNVRLLQQDMARVKLFLAREGFPAATVTPLATLTDPDGRLGVTLSIDPGPPVLVAVVETPGWPAGLPLPDPRSAGLLRPQERFTDSRLERSRAALLGPLLDSGYAFAAVGAAVRPVAPDSVAVVHGISPGERMDITAVEVAGCSADLMPLARRLLDLEPPVLFSRSRLEDAALNLRSTRLFRRVELNVEPSPAAGLTLDVVAEDARMKTIESSLGTWSDNPLMFGAGWSHRNLLGGGRGLEVDATAATHRLTLGGGLNWFGWLSPRGRSRAGAEWVREDEDAYLAKEFRLTLAHNLRSRRGDMTQVGMSLSRVSLDPHGADEDLQYDRDGGLTEIWVDHKWDRTDDPIDPGDGGFARLVATWSPPGGFSESPYLSIQGDFSLYRGFGPGAVLACRGRAGWAEPLGDAKTLIPNRRFYAGGFNTMRGYGRRRLGPRDDDGDPSGGDAVLLAGLEARFELAWILGAAAFIDAGQVWPRPGDVRLQEMETAAGLALDVRTPLGPVRIGVARNLGDVWAEEPRTTAHFGVGYPW